MSRGSNESKAKTYSASEASEILGISKNALLDHARAGTLYPPIRYIAAGQAIRFSKIDVDNAVGEHVA